MPVVAFLPLWAIVFGGAFGERASEGPVGPVAVGQGVYTAAGCAGCHGPTGGGGVGPAMGDVAKVFPSFADHVSWVKTGSAAFKGQTYGTGTLVATGGMPGFEGALSEEDIVAVVCYERVTFGGEEPPPECAEGAPEGEAASDGG